MPADDDIESFWDGIRPSRKLTPDGIAGVNPGLLRILAHWYCTNGPFLSWGSVPSEIVDAISDVSMGAHVERDLTDLWERPPSLPAPNPLLCL